jgi:arylsulfatase
MAIERRMHFLWAVVLAAASVAPCPAAASGGTPEAAVATPAPPSLDRTVLPIPEPTHAPITEVDVRRATPPPRF